MTSSKTSEEILEESRTLVQTEGEWELVNVDVKPFLLVLEEGNYTQVKYFVSNFIILTILSFYLILYLK